MFLECSAESRGIFFKEDIIDFGFSPSGIKSEPREITLVNNLNIDVQAYWAIPNLPNSTIKMYQLKSYFHYSNFQINPVMFEVPKKSEKVIKIVFNPNEPNVYYFHKLQLYTFRKTGHENK